jgi:Protein of unknown function (DUF3768)
VNFSVAKSEAFLGNFEIAGVSYFFKIDYYSPDMQGGSEDPGDSEKTTRVLTIMSADEC